MGRWATWLPFSFARCPFSTFRRTNMFLYKQRSSAACFFSQRDWRDQSRQAVPRRLRPRFEGDRGNVEMSLTQGPGVSGLRCGWKRRAPKGLSLPARSQSLQLCKGCAALRPGVMWRATNYFNYMGRNIPPRAFRYVRGCPLTWLHAPRSQEDIGSYTRQMLLN